MGSLVFALLLLGFPCFKSTLNNSLMDVVFQDGNPPQTVGQTVCPPCAQAMGALGDFSSLLPSRRRAPVPEGGCSGISVGSPLLLTFLSSGALLEVYGGTAGGVCGYLRNTSTSNAGSPVALLSLTQGPGAAPIVAASFYAHPMAAFPVGYPMLMVPLLGWLVLVEGPSPAPSPSRVHVYELLAPEEGSMGGVRAGLVPHASPTCSNLTMPWPAAGVSSTDAMQLPLATGGQRGRPVSSIFSASPPSLPLPPAQAAALFIFSSAASQGGTASLVVAKDKCSALAPLGAGGGGGGGGALALDSVYQSPFAATRAAATSWRALSAAGTAVPRPLFHRLALSQGVGVTAQLLVSSPPPSLISPRAAAALEEVLPVALSAACPWEGGETEALARISALSWTASSSVAPLGVYLGNHALWGGTAGGSLLEWSVALLAAAEGSAGGSEGAWGVNRPQRQQQQPHSGHPARAAYLALSRLSLSCTLRNLWPSPIAAPMHSAQAPIAALLSFPPLLLFSTLGGRVGVLQDPAPVLPSPAHSAPRAASPGLHKLPERVGKAGLVLVSPPLLEGHGAGEGASSAVHRHCIAASASSGALVLAQTRASPKEGPALMFDCLLSTPHSAAPTAGSPPASVEPLEQDPLGTSMISYLFSFLRGPIIFFSVGALVWWNRRGKKRARWGVGGGC